MRQLVDSSGNVTLSQSYAPYGDTLTSAGDGVSAFQYTGEARDASGLTYLRARYLDTRVGHFTSRDTWAGDNKRPLSLNRWNYVEGNPVNLTDPSGFCPGAQDETNPCWALLMQIERQFGMIDLKADLSDDDYWAIDELLNIQDDLELYELASGLSLTTLYPENVRIKRVRKDKGTTCGMTYFYFTKGRPIKLYNTWEEGCLIHELAHYLDRANLHLAKPFEKHVGASTFLWWYNVGNENPPIYDGGNPPNRYEDFAESLTEYVELNTNRPRNNIGIIPGERRWYFIESVLDTGRQPFDDYKVGCIPELGILTQVGLNLGGY